MSSDEHRKRRLKKYIRRQSQKGKRRPKGPSPEVFVAEAEHVEATAEMYASRNRGPLHFWMTAVFWILCGTFAGSFFWVCQNVGPDGPARSFWWFALTGAGIGATLRFLGMPTIRNLGRWATGAILGSVACSSVWLAQSLPPSEPAAEWWVYVIVGAGMGAMIGALWDQHRTRKCPSCKRSMGPAQNLRIRGAKRAARPENRIPDGALVAQSPRDDSEFVKTYYLCPHCDREYLAIDLEYRGRTG